MLRNLILLLTLLTGVIAMHSCKKTSPCEAEITVKDTLGRPIAGARVVLRQDSVVNPTNGVRANIFDEQFTTGSGQAFFTFQWEAVLNVEVDFDTLQARDFIRLEQSNTVRKTIILK